ncbi:hypothetical protein SeMB42_g00352 [Synchytrium endobioticum]|uniref:Uncharacterized protein n=1 Tax=Synchytrium endobioticum TaxID=286115 RepID=A0A507DTL4_9FUNG|nr:hypothetical protein SeLEV6574_g00920 [Synchytrium endobioticum]TPX54285.1 hypothetical protein SeMB42_g00350 [Synchytrium endobioticum]TPX54288.1 hypothetical protein SeMB42_g00352 [Synchytrium endobioticum]
MEPPTSTHLLAYFPSIPAQVGSHIDTASPDSAIETMRDSFQMPPAPTKSTHWELSSGPISNLVLPRHLFHQQPASLGLAGYGSRRSGTSSPMTWSILPSMGVDARSRSNSSADAHSEELLNTAKEQVGVQVLKALEAIQVERQGSSTTVVNDEATTYGTFGTLAQPESSNVEITIVVASAVVDQKQTLVQEKPPVMVEPKPIIELPPRDNSRQSVDSSDDDISDIDSISDDEEAEIAERRPLLIPCTNPSQTPIAAEPRASWNWCLCWRIDAEYE